VSFGVVSADYTGPYDWLQSSSFWTVCERDFLLADLLWSIPIGRLQSSPHLVTAQRDRCSSDLYAWTSLWQWRHVASSREIESGALRLSCRNVSGIWARALLAKRVENEDALRGLGYFKLKIPVYYRLKNRYKPITGRHCPSCTCTANDMWNVFFRTKTNIMCYAMQIQNIAR